MSQFYFQAQRRKARIGLRKVLSYNVIVSYQIPPLDFPDDASAAAWDDALDLFGREFSRWGDLDPVIADGREMYGFEYGFVLANWIYSEALRLGANAQANIPQLHAQETAEGTDQQSAQSFHETEKATNAMERANAETQELLGG